MGDMPLRTPPSAVEAEQAVLGALMLDIAKLPELADWLSHRDFYRRDHQLIYRAICHLAAKSMPTDAVTIADWLDANNLGEQAGGMSYLIDLASTTPSAANVVAYAEIVHEKSKLRQAIEAGCGLVDSAFDPQGQSAGDILAQAQYRINALAPSRRSGLQAAKPILVEWIADLQARYEGKKLPGLPYPWKALNDATGGLLNEELTVIAGRSNMGKSTLAFQIAAFTALRGNRVAVFSLESSKKAVMQRMVSALGEIPNRWLRQPDDEHDYWPRVTSAISQLKDCPLWIDDTARLEPMQIRARAMREHIRQPVKLVVIDHLQEVKLTGKRNEASEMGDAMREFKALQKELGCPVIVLSQLNRDAAKDGQRPSMVNLKSSGGIEEVADVVVLLHRWDYYKPNDRSGLVEAIIGKGRDIRTGDIIPLRNRFDIMRADDWDGPAIVEQQEPIGTGFGAKKWGREMRASDD